jgi:pyruvate kinase
MFDNYNYVKKILPNFKENLEGRTEGTFTNFDSLDDKIDDLYYYMQYIKFGFGRSTRDVSRFIQNGHLNKLNGLKFIKKYTTLPICIDSEGAQIRTGNLLKELNLKKNKILKIYKKKNFFLYPDNVFNQLIKGDRLTLDFNSAIIEILYSKKKYFLAKVLSSGKVGKNKAVTLNRDIKLDSFTNKDIEAFKIGKKNNIKHYAISFASSKDDIVYARELLGKKTFLISKIESFSGLTNCKDIINLSDATLIDRGDLSRHVQLISIPVWQKKLCFLKKKLNKKIYIATNLLESMITNKEPTRAEVNDIYNSLRDGADGLVLAAETAIGKNPLMAVKIIKNCIKNFKKNRIFETENLNMLNIKKQIKIEKKFFQKRFEKN